MKRDYQRNYSSNTPSVFDHSARTRKAITTLSVLQDVLNKPTKTLSLLVAGGSSGIIDKYLSDHFLRVVSLDIDELAIRYAAKTFQADNLHFLIGDALKLSFPDNAFDIIVCSHVYEHVPDADILMSEIFRSLKPGGICYFAAGNRLNIREPHHNLLFLSILPRPIAHLYMRMANKGTHYYEKHLSYWGLRKLVQRFNLTDYSCKLIYKPVEYKFDYMLQPGSKKQFLARLFCRYAPWLLPGYIWILEKPGASKQ